MSGNLAWTVRLVKTWEGTQADGRGPTGRQRAGNVERDTDS